MAVVRNFLKMLKPGGYVQWDEVDIVNMHVAKIEDEVQAPALERLREMTYANGRHDWTLDIAKYLECEGFDTVRREFYGNKTEMLRAFGEQHLLTQEEFASRLMRDGANDKALEYYNLVGDGYKETLNGAALCVPRLVCIGRKPE
ncbi:MAG: hypothetical protein Q9227_003608 [Pyrenula ochraceoflavens]